MSQHQQQQQQGPSTAPDAANTKDTNIDGLDYLSINRARWDERAPHVSKLSLSELKRSHVTVSAKQSEKEET
jgi:hypothetical protein